MSPLREPNWSALSTLGKSLFRSFYYQQKNGLGVKPPCRLCIADETHGPWPMHLDGCDKLCYTLFPHLYWDDYDNICPCHHDKNAFNILCEIIAKAEEDGDLV
jgi:hypothetical protein